LHAGDLQKAANCNLKVLYGKQGGGGKRKPEPDDSTGTGTETEKKK